MSRKHTSFHSVVSDVNRENRNVLTEDSQTGFELDGLR